MFHFSSGEMAPRPPLSKPTFRPSRPTNHWKNIVFRDFPNISRTCIFFLLALSLSLFCSSLFYSSLFCSSRLCFSSLHVVGSLTSKLPLISVDLIFGCLFFPLCQPQRYLLAWFSGFYGIGLEPLDWAFMFRSNTFSRQVI